MKSYKSMKDGSKTEFGQFVNFDYETVDGTELEIDGEILNGKVKFRLFDDKKTYSKSKLTTIDIRNIEEFILENAGEIESLMELDDRSEYD